MAENEEVAEGEDEAPKKKPRKPLLIGLILALLLGAGGFYAVYSGMILAPPSEQATAAEHGASAESLPPVAFVPVEPLVISLGPRASSRHLRFRAQLEVSPEYQKDVELLLPRVLDVLNSYLRAVDLRDIEDPAALINLRAQMLRRIQLVTGEGRVRDLLVMEFVLN